MFYHDFQFITQLKQQEAEKKAKQAWKFFTTQTPAPAPTQCCVVPANA